MSGWLDHLRRRCTGRAGRNRITFTGDYGSWDQAQRDAVGYDAAVILEKTREALLKVKRGEAVAERDSVLFDHVQYSFPVLAGLLRAALAAGGELGVVDFGGSLGSSYFQCRSFLRGVRRLEWMVIEQPAHVACGQQHFASEELLFYPTVQEAVGRHRTNTLLLSSVLQYLPDPYPMLRDLLQHGLECVIIDRTAFLTADRDRLTVQQVPDSIYPASYPAWFFSETRLTRTVTEAGYRLVADFAGADQVSPDDEAAYFKGFIFEKGDA